MTTQFSRRQLMARATGVVAGAITASRFHPIHGQTPSPSALYDELARLAEQLGTGSVVLYLRHPATSRGGVDSPDLPREEQRLLSEEGEDQARTLGAAFEKHGWKTDEVLTSPFWRCRDAAEIAFGDYEVDELLMGLLSRDEGREERLQYSLEKLAEPVKDGAVRVMIGHTSNIRESTGESLAEGAGVVARPGEDGTFEVLGVVGPDDWKTLAG